MAVEVYPEKSKEKVIYSNQQQPLEFGEHNENQGSQLLVKVDYADFDGQETYALDLHINK